jgi:hypothetical protein
MRGDAPESRFATRGLELAAEVARLECRTGACGDHSPVSLQLFPSAERRSAWSFCGMQSADRQIPGNGKVASDGSVCLAAQ